MNDHRVRGHVRDVPLDAGVNRHAQLARGIGDPLPDRHSLSHAHDRLGTLAEGPALPQEQPDAIDLSADVLKRLELSFRPINVLFDAQHSRDHVAAVLPRWRHRHDTPGEIIRGDEEIIRRARHRPAVQTRPRPHHGPSGQHQPARLAVRIHPNAPRKIAEVRSHGGAVRSRLSHRAVHRCLCVTADQDREPDDVVNRLDVSSRPPMSEQR